MARCDKPLRGSSDRCALDQGHRGRHSSIAFVCDACGKTRRGYPHAYGRDGEYETGLAFCFLCAGPPAGREADKLEWRYGL